MYKISQVIRKKSFTYKMVPIEISVFLLRALHSFVKFN